MKAFCACLTLLAAVGCAQFQPTGPLAGAMKARPAAAPAADKDRAAPTPTIVPAPRPVPPAVLIVPEAVSANTANADAQKLEDELSYDNKTIAPARASEVPVIRDGAR